MCLKVNESVSVLSKKMVGTAVVSNTFKKKKMTASLFERHALR